MKKIIGDGSIYALEVKLEGAKIILTDMGDNQVMFHHDEIPAMIEFLTKINKGECDEIS